MKKLLAIILALTLTGCANLSSSDTDSSEEKINIVTMTKKETRYIVVEGEDPTIVEDDKAQKMEAIQKEAREDFINTVKDTFENIESGNCKIEYSLYYNTENGRQGETQTIDITAASNAILFDVTKNGQTSDSNGAISPYSEKLNQVLDYDYNNIFEFVEIPVEEIEETEEEPEYTKIYPYRNGYWYNFDTSPSTIGTISDIFYNLVYYALRYDEDMILEETETGFLIETDIVDICDILKYFNLENNYGENENIPCTVKMTLNKKYEPVSFELTYYHKIKMNDAVANNRINLNTTTDPNVSVDLKVIYSNINKVDNIDLTDIHNNISDEQFAINYKELNFIVHP